MKPSLVLITHLLLFITACGNRSDTIHKPSILLYAEREAPVGRVQFTAYADSSFEYSLIPREVFKGRYVLKGDSLFLTCANSNIGIDTIVIREKSLQFYGKKSPKFAGIVVNALMKDK